MARASRLPGSPSAVFVKEPFMTTPCDPLAQLRQRDPVQRLADFINEVGMLRFTPRTGYQFLGTGKENVAEHSHRTAVIGYALAKMAGADAARTALLCLFHDLAEARTGDFNYVNRMYNTSQPRLAMQHATEGTGLTEDILGFWDELEGNATAEANLAHDADQLDMIFNLKRESENGNAFADQWLGNALQRLRTDEGRRLGRTAAETPTSFWWYNGPGNKWWEQKR